LRSENLGLCEENEMKDRTKDTVTTPPDETEGPGFAALGLDPRLVKVLGELGYEEPTPIQREAIPPLLEGRDLMGMAATGTGKTAAFALPMLNSIASLQEGERRGSNAPEALILVPTRELAMQVAEAVHKYGRGFGVRVLPIYGGQAIEQQLRVLKRGVDVVVATPGRALDHIQRRTMRLDSVRTVVLDEADEMLDMGFAEDLEAILQAVPKERQTALFSATIAPRIAAIAERHLKNPVKVRIATDRVAAGEIPRVRQTAYVVPRAHKMATLGRVLDMENPTAALVFCRTRHEVDELTETLNSRGYRAEALHGGMSQEQRDRVMKLFRKGTADLLVATDVAARGLDIDHLSHVVNYDVPSAPEAYVHRIGRTGRAGREGIAITLAEPREHRMLRNIELVTKQKISIETVPTVADLRARRLELTRAALRETILGGDLDGFRVVVQSLSEEFDVIDIAAAGVKVAHAATTGEAEETEIPLVTPSRDRGERGPRGADGAKGGKGGKGGKFGGGARERPAARGGARAQEDGSSRPGGKRKPAWEVAKLYVGAGRAAGVRPGDLVGAIANEVGIDAAAIGAIQVADKFSMVEVPAEIIDDIITALRGTTIKGKRVMVRRDREGA
jgi:ATP-dependent RNA helicase DeaD